MGIQRIDVTATTTAAPPVVYRLVCDGMTWPTWSAVGSYELVTPGAEDGLGEVRIFRTGRVASRERVVELVPDKRQSYELVSGLAIRDYRAYIDLDSTGTGTRIHWYSSFVPKVPGTGGIYRRTLRKFIQQSADGLAAYAASLPD